MIYFICRRENLGDKGRSAEQPGRDEQVDEVGGGGRPPIQYSRKCRIHWRLAEAAAAATPVVVAIAAGFPIASHGTLAALQATLVSIE